MTTTIETNPPKVEVTWTSRLRLTLGRIAGYLRHTSNEERVLGALVAILALNLAASAVDGRGFGNASSYPLVPLAGLVLLAGLSALFVMGGRIVRTVLAAALGLTAVFLGIAVNVAHILITGPVISDYTGILSTIAGILLLGFAFRIGFHRPRWFVYVIAAPMLLFIVINWVVGPAIQAGIATNAPRTTSSPASALGVPGATDVVFPATNGVQLVGWYVPGWNGAAVILLHGSHATRSSTIQHLRMLTQAGFAVLA